jgi:FAD:protein FMN transferase
MIKVEFKAMGCQMAAFLDNDEPESARALQQTPAWFEEWEQILSRFRADSDLNRLNDSFGMPVPVPSTLWEVVKLSLETAHWTGGLVIPTVLNSMIKAGYSQSFEYTQSINFALQPAVNIQLLERVTAGGVDMLASWHEIELDEVNQTITLPPGLKMDLGGIGKGWAAQQAMLRLSDFGPVLIDASGDIAVSGSRSDGTPWPIGVADPLQMQEDLDLLALENCGVATSGIDYRRWQKNGVWKHHIIDPRTGDSAITDVMSATIIAPDSVQAEAAAKVVLILGSQAGVDWLEDHPQLAGLLALQDGRLLYSYGMDQYLWR